MSRGPISPLINGWTLLLAGLVVYLPLFWQLPLIRAEAMYALIPREMLASGSWLTPSLNGVPYLDKPHLLYWLNLAALRVLGVSDWSARVPTLAVTLGEVGVTYLIGRRLLGRQAAWLGGFVLLSSIGFFALHLQILTDHLVSLALAASLYFLLRWQEEPARRWAVLFHLALVAGFLSKGFVGLAFPLLIGALTALYLRQPRLWALLASPSGLALLALLLIPWGVASELANPGFLKHQLLNEQVLRFLGQRQPPDIVPFSLPGFWLFLGIWLLPWAVLLPEALYRFWRETGPAAGERRREILLLIWPLVVLGFFTLSSSRIEYYSLPALPPLALILGWRLARYLAAPRERAPLLALLVLGGLGLATLFLLPHFKQLCAGNRREFLGMFTLLTPMARRVVALVPTLVLAGVAVGRRRPGVILATFSALALMLVLFTFRTLAILSPHLSDQLPGDYVRLQAGPRDLVVMEQIEEFEYAASFAYYAGRRLLMVQRHGLPQFAHPVPPQKNYLISPEHLRELWQGPGRVFLLIDDATPPEPYLEGAKAVLTVQGKRLLVNRP